MNKNIEESLEKLSAYCNSEYGFDWYNFLGFIEDIADKQSIMRDDDRRYLFSLVGSNEVYISIDDMKDKLKQQLRKKDDTFFADEVLACMRLCRMFYAFDTSDAPYDDEGFKRFCLNHPRWPRIERQAQLTLELFKKNRLKRKKFTWP